jgi:hypothetical protein
VCQKSSSAVYLIISIAELKDVWKLTYACCLSITFLHWSIELNLIDIMISCIFKYSFMDPLLPNPVKLLNYAVIIFF